MPSDLRRKNITTYRSHQVFCVLVFLSCLGILAVYHPLQAYSPQDVGESQLITMAVIDLEGKGISQLEASTLTDRLRTSLVQTGKVTVLKRALMEEVLNEAGFQQTGCTSIECAVEFGKILRVNQIVSGGIAKIRTTYTVYVRMIDIRRGRILRISSRDYTGDIDGLQAVIQQTALDLVTGLPSIIKPEESQPVADAEKGELVLVKGIGRRLFWIGLGAVAAGGAVYYVMSQQQPAPTETGFPKPPGRP